MFIDECEFVANWMILQPTRTIRQKIKSFASNSERRIEKFRSVVIQRTSNLDSGLHPSAPRAVKLVLLLNLNLTCRGCRWAKLPTSDLKSSRFGLQGKDKMLPVVNIPIVAETKVASLWVLLPEANPYERFELFAYDAETGRLVKSIEPTYSFEMEDGTVFGWMLVDPSQKYAYECHWHYGAELSD